MTRAQRVIVILLICAVAGIIAGVTIGDREPRYQGKRLSEYVHLKDPTWRGEFPEESIQALKHIGTNAIPYLLKTLTYRPPRWQKILAYKFHITHFSRLDEQTDDRKLAAIAAFGVLGPQAKPAISELTRLMTNTNQALCSFASMALGEIGSDAIPVLLDLLTNRPAHTNFGLVNPNPAWILLGTPTHTALNLFNLTPAWITLGTNAITTIPVVLDHLADRDPEVVAASCSILMSLAAREIRRDTIIAGLCNRLASTNTTERTSAAHLLGQIGHEDSRILPLLRNALNDPDLRVQTAARDAIQRLEPHAKSNTNNDKSSDVLH